MGHCANSGRNVRLHAFATTGSFRFRLLTLTCVSGGNGSSLTVSPSQTTSYYAVATSSCGTARSSDAAVTVIVCGAPVVTSPAAPTAIVLRIGNTKTLTVQATGSGPLSYQWFASEPEGTSYFPIPGANGATLAVSPETTSRYFVRVTNECGTVDSPYFRVMVWDGNGDPPGPQIL